MRQPLVFLLLLLVGCGPKRPSAPPTTPQPSPTPLALEGVVTKPATVLFDPTGSGKRILEYQGTTLTLQPGQTPLKSQRMKATLYRDGRPVLVVEAPQIEADLRQLTAHGGVSASVLGQDGARRFQCGTLTWQPKSNRVIGVGQVFVQYKGLAQVSGSRIEADLTLNTLELLP